MKLTTIRPDTGGRMRPRKTWIRLIACAAIGLAALLAVAACSASSPASTAGTSPKGPAPSATGTTTATASRSTPPAGQLGLGQTATFGDLRITVTSGTRVPREQDKPAYMITVTYENRGASSLPFSESDWTIEGVTGTEKPSDTLLDQPTLGSRSIAAGSKKTGSVIFVCPGEVKRITVKPPHTTGTETQAIWAP
ncbi:MAG TPA: DUF4352 domain-containing protein [Coriobacteriia bacterium]